jgi:hypothetical protein
VRFVHSVGDEIVCHEGAVALVEMSNKTFKLLLDKTLFRFGSHHLVFSQKDPEYQVASL